MSTCSTIFFEYKIRKQTQWRLIEALVPEVFRDGSYDEPYSWPDENHLVDFGESKMWKMFSLTKQGDVRDLLAGHNSPFNDRGFPKDMSSELQSIFERMQLRVEELKKTEPWRGDYGWGRSWCLLSELNEYIDAQMEKCKASILSEHTKQLNFGITKKLDKILAIVSGKEYISKKEKSEYNPEMMDYYLEERLPQLLSLRDFASGISILCEFLTDEYPDDTEIRLVFYAC